MRSEPSCPFVTDETKHDATYPEVREVPSRGMVDLNVPPTALHPLRG